MTIKDFLDGCRKNQAIYTTLKLDNAFDLNELTNFTSQVRDSCDTSHRSINTKQWLWLIMLLWQNHIQLDVKGELDDISLTDTKIIPDDVVEDVEKYSDLGIQNIKISEFNSEVYHEHLCIIPLFLPFYFMLLFVQGTGAQALALSFQILPIFACL